MNRKEINTYLIKTKRPNEAIVGELERTTDAILAMKQLFEVFTRSTTTIKGEPGDISPHTKQLMFEFNQAIDQIKTAFIAQLEEARISAKGERGDQGPRGDKGDTGPAGPRGPRGDKGDTGPMGLPGAPGRDGKDGNTITELEVKQKLEQLPIQEQWFDARHIKGLPKASATRKHLGRGTGSSVVAYDLSSQCNGSNKTFTIPSFTTALMLIGTDAPINYKYGTDWTATGTTLTITSTVNAPSSGATLTFLYA